jgi:cell division protein FtsB
MGSAALPFPVAGRLASPYDAPLDGLEDAAEAGMTTGIGPFGERPPARPQVGAGRTALVRRVEARGGRERSRAAQAARRGMQRGPTGRLLKRVAEVDFPAPVKTAFAEVFRQSRVVQQKYLPRQKLRTIGLGLAAIWAVWTFILSDAAVPRLLWVRYQNERLERQVKKLEVEEAKLRDEVETLHRGGDELVDKLAREEHAMVKDGEILVRFYDD